MQNKAPYATKPISPEFKSGVLLHPKDAGFIKPSQEDLNRLVAVTGWNKRTIAELLDIHYSEKSGSATVRKWFTTSSSHSPIPSRSWRLLLIFAGIVKAKEDVEFVLNSQKNKYIEHLKTDGQRS